MRHGSKLDTSRKEHVDKVSKKIEKWAMWSFKNKGYIKYKQLINKIEYYEKN